MQRAAERVQHRRRSGGDGFASLPIDAQQRVEILKLLYRGAKRRSSSTSRRRLARARADRRLFATLEELRRAGALGRDRHAQAGRGDGDRRPRDGAQGRQELARRGARGVRRAHSGARDDRPRARGAPARGAGREQSEATCSSVRDLVVHAADAARCRARRQLRRRGRTRSSASPASRATASASSSDALAGVRQPASGSIMLERRRRHARRAAALARGRRQRDPRGPAGLGPRPRHDARREPRARAPSPRAGSGAAGC